MLEYLQFSFIFHWNCSFYKQKYKNDKMSKNLNVFSVIRTIIM